MIFVIPIEDELKKREAIMTFKALTGQAPGPPGYLTDCLLNVKISATL